MESGVQPGVFTFAILAVTVVGWALPEALTSALLRESTRGLSRASAITYHQSRTMVSRVVTVACVVGFGIAGLGIISLL